MLISTWCFFHFPLIAMLSLSCLLPSTAYQNSGVVLGCGPTSATASSASTARNVRAKHLLSGAKKGINLVHPIAGCLKHVEELGREHLGLCQQKWKEKGENEFDQK
jgi:hypothetical protein